MFNNKHLNMILGEIGGFRKKSAFSPKKSLVAYRLSKMNSQYRGMVVEKMIRDFYICRGKRVKYCGGNRSFDMIVDSLKVEVKSAMAVPNMTKSGIQYSYHFQHIRPKNFHKLVLVFINPEGLNIRVMNSNTVSKYLKTKTKHKSLYVRKKIMGKVLAA